MANFWILPALLLGVWFWLDGMRAREAAIRTARRACERNDVQLLDETVALSRLRLARVADGGLGWQRRYRFEFTLQGETRRAGEVELLGRQVTLLQLALDDYTLHECRQDEVRH